MKILFTKKLKPVEVSKTLDSCFRYDCIPVIETECIPCAAYDISGKTLLFTSVAGVDAFFENEFQAEQDFTKKKFNKILAVGKKTKNALRKRGFHTYHEAKNAAYMRHFILEYCDGEKILHFCGDLALDVMKKRDAEESDVSYKKRVVYHTVLLYPKIEEDYNAVVFFSPSGVKSYFKNNAPKEAKLFSIGNTTTEELKKYAKSGYQVYTSQKSTLQDLLKLINKKLNTDNDKK